MQEHHKATLSVQRACKLFCAGAFAHLYRGNARSHRAGRRSHPLVVLFPRHYFTIDHTSVSIIVFRPSVLRPNAMYLDNVLVVLICDPLGCDLV